MRFRATFAAATWAMAAYICPPCLQADPFTFKLVPGLHYATDPFDHGGERGGAAINTYLSAGVYFADISTWAYTTLTSISSSEKNAGAVATWSDDLILQGDPGRTRQIWIERKMSGNLFAQAEGSGADSNSKITFTLSLDILPDVLLGFTASASVAPDCCNQVHQDKNVADDAQGTQFRSLTVGQTIRITGRLEATAHSSVNTGAADAEANFSPPLYSPGARLRIGIVPEPSGWILYGCGLAAVVLRTRIFRR